MSETGATVRAAVVQTSPLLGEPRRNLDDCLDRLAEAAADGCRLVVFPECALSGYMVETRAEALRLGEEIPGSATVALASACARLGVHCVLGMLERDGDALRNSAVLIGPEGLLGRYRKSHIARIGVDRFTLPGEEPYQVFDTAVGRIGMQICYDWRFPEISRALALAGADVIASPTNSPAASRELAEYLPRARASENAVFFLLANRVGSEHGTRFFGWSQIVGPLGRRLAEAGGERQAVVAADLDLEQARAKTREPAPGVYQVRLFADRRPGLYDGLAAREAGAARR